MNYGKYYMLKKDVLKFYNKNKSYCSMPFKEIYINFVVMQKLLIGNTTQ